jgi:hypothetical protein
VLCGHDGFHSVTTRYDRKRGLLIFVRTCDGCGGVVSEVARERYRPRFEPPEDRAATQVRTR